MAQLNRSPHCSDTSGIGAIVLQNLEAFADGPFRNFYLALFALPNEAVAAVTHQLQRLMRQLRRTSSCRWRWTAQKFGEPPQVLRGRSKQDLVPDAAQAPQSKPVEPQDALHMRKSHLDLLAFAARLLERLRVGKSANAVSHVLIDVSGHLSAGARRALCLEIAS